MSSSYTWTVPLAFGGEREEEDKCRRRSEKRKGRRGEEGKRRGSGVTGGRFHGCAFPSLNFHTLSLFSVLPYSVEQVRESNRQGEFAVGD